MRNVLLLGVVLGIAGLVVGYFIFARAPITGDYIAIETLLNPPAGIIGRLMENVGQFAEIRRNIVVSGVVGAVSGVVLGVLVSRR